MMNIANQTTPSRETLADTQFDFGTGSADGWQFYGITSQQIEMPLTPFIDPRSPTSGSRLLLDGAPNFYVARDICHPGARSPSACVFVWTPRESETVKLRGEVSLLQASVRGGGHINVQVGDTQLERCFDFPEYLEFGVTATIERPIRIELRAPQILHDTIFLYYFTIERADTTDVSPEAFLQTSVSPTWFRLAEQLGVPDAQPGMDITLSPVPIRDPFPLPITASAELIADVAHRIEVPGRSLGAPGFYRSTSDD